jgi:DNA end-binding protein Ku
LRPSGESLVLHELHHREELRKPVEVPRGEAAVKPSELKLGERLVEQAENETFHPERYPDEVRDRVRALIRKKAQGEEVTIAPSESRKGQVIDLMEALKASLARKSRSTESSSRPAKHKPGHRKTNDAPRRLAAKRPRRAAR